MRLHTFLRGRVAALFRRMATWLTPPLREAGDDASAASPLGAVRPSSIEQEILRITAGRSRVAMDVLLQEVAGLATHPGDRSQRILIGRHMQRLGWERKRVRVPRTQLRSYVYVRKTHSGAEAVDE